MHSALSVGAAPVGQSTPYIEMGSVPMGTAVPGQFSDVRERHSPRAPPSAVLVHMTLNAKGRVRVCAAFVRVPQRREASPRSLPVPWRCHRSALAADHAVPKLMYDCVPHVRLHGQLFYDWVPAEQPVPRRRLRLWCERER